MDLTTIRAGLSQNGLTSRANQPSCHNLFSTARAFTGQWDLGRQRFVELQADIVKNDRQTDHKQQEHGPSHCLRQFVAGIADILFDPTIAQVDGAIKPVQVLAVMRNHDDRLAVFMQFFQ